MTVFSKRKILTRGARAWCAIGTFWLMLLMLVEARAQDFTYTNIGGAIRITGTASSYGLMGPVSIPNTIEGLPVVSIGGGAFLTNWFLTSVMIPSSITNIGGAAFAQSYQLTNAIMQEGVTTIEGSAFLECRMPTVSIPNSVTSIGDRAFNACSALTNVTIGSGVTNIGDAAFGECYKLSSLFFKGNAPIAGVSLFEYDQNETVYHLPETTGWGTTFSGAPAKVWNPHIHTGDGDFGVHHRLFGFNIAGTADIPLVVEASTNAAEGSWVTLLAGTLSSGFIYFSDPQWTNYPNRLYRIRSP